MLAEGDEGGRLPDDDVVDELDADSFAASAIRPVKARSSALGYGSPLGWLWKERIPAALTINAAVRMPRGSTGARVRVPMWASSCPIPGLRVSRNRAPMISRSEDDRMEWRNRTAAAGSPQCSGDF